MENTTTCKHCNGTAERSYVSGPFGVEEDHIACQCGYWYEFLYGYNVEYIPGKPVMAWNYINSEPVVFTMF